MLDVNQLAADAAEWAGLLGGADKALEQAARSTAALIDRIPTAPRDDNNQLMADAYTAAVMLTVRLYRRRNSPTGIEAQTDLGTTYIARFDPDIARALRLDRYAPPIIG